MDMDGWSSNQFRTQRENGQVLDCIDESQLFTDQTDALVLYSIFQRQ